MGNSTTFFRDRALSGADYYVECWLYFLACEVDELQDKPDWLLEAQNDWNIKTRIGLIGTISADLDKYVINDERLQIVLAISEKTIQRFESFGESVKTEQIKNLGNLDLISDERNPIADPIEYFSNANPTKLRQYGTLFCELLLGTLHPAKERIMRGYGFFRYGYLVDYLDTLIPDGENGTGYIHLDEHGEEQINLHPAVYWLSDKNSSAHFTTFERRGVLKHGYCIGMPDLIIDVYPLNPWYKERVEFDIHELYGLQEHWYIDDEEHTVTIRRLMDGKLVVVETLHAGEQFTSKSLGGKIVDVDTLLRTE